MEMVGVLMKTFFNGVFPQRWRVHTPKLEFSEKKNVTKKNNVRKTSDGRKRLVGGGKLDEFLALDE